MIKSVQELQLEISAKAKAVRLAQNLTQLGLEQRSGVALGTIKKFERTGIISLESLLRLAVTLGSTNEFDALFPNMESTRSMSLDAILKQPKPRKRGRVT